MEKELLKEAAAYLEDLLQKNAELEESTQKHTAIEKIAQIFIKQHIITTLPEYFVKVAELNEKSLNELQNIAQFMELVAPKVKEEFGKLANVSLSKIMSNLSAEEQFNLSILEVT